MLYSPDLYKLCLQLSQLIKHVGEERIEYHVTCPNWVILFLTVWDTCILVISFLGFYKKFIVKVLFPGERYFHCNKTRGKKQW